MQRSDFHFDLPEDLIAYRPAAQRDGSRLLAVEGEAAPAHRQFPDIVDYLQAGDLLVFNDTRVIPARLYAQKQTGGRVEILIERMLDEHRAIAHLRASKSPKAGAVLSLAANEQADPGGDRVEVTGRDGALFALRFDRPVLDVLQQWGHMPLPPYIDRQDEAEDRERYQTVYASRDGAVAAPTAGLHFTEALIAQCREKGVDTAFVTLHVGAGTFQSVRVDDIREHQMHSEYIEVSDAVCRQVEAARARGGRVVAVGTTSVRSLESACRASGQLAPFQGDSDIFIYPGYRFKCVDAMITNFHLPESTLIMLVSAFMGRERILAAYREAVAQRYRFFSYGDAMLLLPSASTDNKSTDNRSEHRE